MIGELAERIICSRIGGHRHKTDSRCDYCPDVSVGSMFFECKAVGLTNQMFIYAGRLNNDRLFAANHMLWYAVVHHRTSTKKWCTVKELETAVITSIRCIYLIPFSVVSAKCIKEVPLNSKYGSSQSNKRLYGSGFRLPLSWFTEWMV